VASHWYVLNSCLGRPVWPVMWVDSKQWLHTIHILRQFPAKSGYWFRPDRRRIKSESHGRMTSGLPTSIRNRVGRCGGRRDKPSPLSGVVVLQRHHHSRALGWQHSGDQKRPRSKVENQVARHCKLIMPLTVVICLVIPGALETQFRTQLDRCADPMAPHDRVL
jgi:hypothetical protein